MPICNARNNSQGFTMIEIIVILMIIGILSAIAAPSFLAMYNKGKLNNALTQVQGALQEAQRESIRKSKLCPVTLDLTNNQVTSSCFVTGERSLVNDVAMATNISPVTDGIQFSFKGNTTIALSGGANSGTVVLYLSNGSGQKKCLAISNGIGIMRTGNYSGSTSSASDITAGTCATSQ